MLPLYSSFDSCSGQPAGLKKGYYNPIGIPSFRSKRIDKRRPSWLVVPAIFCPQGGCLQGSDCTTDGVIGRNNFLTQIGTKTESPQKDMFAFQRLAENMWEGINVTHLFCPIPSFAFRLLWKLENL